MRREEGTNCPLLSPSNSLRAILDRSVRKALFFLRYEGASAVLSKVRSRLRSESIEKSVVSARTEAGDAISFDGGETYYVLHRGSRYRLGTSVFAGGVRAGRSRGHCRTPADRALFLIGCGDYARAQVLPHFSRSERHCCVDHNELPLGIVHGEFTHRCNAHTQMKSSWAAAKRPVCADLFIPQ